MALLLRDAAGMVAAVQTGEVKPELPEQAEEFAERREFVRRSVLRANRAVAVILGVVVMLGGAMVYAGFRSSRNQMRAQRAEAEATGRLWNASLAQARAESLGTKAGHRAAALEALRTAAAIRPSLELRNEAITAMGLRDLVKEREWPLKRNAYGFNFDPDLEYYLVRYTEETLSMFRLEDNSHVRDFKMPSFLQKGSNVGDFVFSGTGKYVVIRYNGGAIVFFERDTGKVVRVIGQDGRIKHYAWPPTFTADDRLMCLTMTGTDGLTVLYDIQTGEPRKLEGLPPEIAYTGIENRVSISPRGDLLAYYSGAGVRVIDAATAAVKHSVSGPSLVQSLNWDVQGDRLSFICDNSTLFVLEVNTGRVSQMGGKAVYPWVQRFSPDGTLLVTAGTDGLTKLWDVATAQLLSEATGWRGLVISRHGTRIAGGVPGRSVGVWRIEEPTAMKIIQGKALERATVWQNDLSADGRWLIWSPPSWTARPGFELLDLERANASVFVGTDRKIAAGLHPAKPQFWTAGQHGLSFHHLPLDKPGEEAALKEPCASLAMPRGFVPWNASFSADGRFVAVAGSGNAVYVFDTENPGSPVRMEGIMRGDADLPGPASATGSGGLAISPDGRWVAGGRNTDGGNPIVWDARSGKVVKRLPATHGHVAFSPDGRWLATVGVRTARLWAAGTWEKQWEKSRPALLSNFGSAAFTGDGSLMAWTRSVDAIELVEPASGEVLAEINASRLTVVTGLHFSASGQRLFAGGTEGKLMAINVDDLRRNLAEMKLDWPLSDPVNRAAITTDGGFSSWTPALLGLVPVSIAAILGGLVLRRQGRLTREFVDATEVAARRTQELAAERELSELKSRFVTTVSHEFRTPLGITMSAVELMRHYGDKLDDAQRDQLYDDIHSATRNMAGLMEQVLVLGRVDAGKLAYRPSLLDLDTLARKLTDESLSATNRKCPIHWSPENDLSGARGDEALLRHIFSNLLSNAVKYSPQGAAVNFTGRREARDAVFTVQDHGIGIPDKDLPHLFEAFHRGGNVGEIPGTGLGLVIIKRCLDLHGGTISVTTKAGEGSTFTVRVPLWAA